MTWAVDVSDSIIDDLLATRKTSVVLSALGEFSLVHSPVFIVTTEVFRGGKLRTSLLSQSGA